VEVPGFSGPLTHAESPTTTTTTTATTTTTTTTLRLNWYNSQEMLRWVDEGAALSARPHRADGSCCVRSPQGQAGTRGISGCCCGGAVADSKGPVRRTRPCRCGTCWVQLVDHAVYASCSDGGMCLLPLVRMEDDRRRCPRPGDGHGHTRHHYPDAHNADGTRNDTNPQHFGTGNHANTPAGTNTERRIYHDRRDGSARTSHAHTTSAETICTASHRTAPATTEDTVPRSGVGRVLAEQRECDANPIRDRGIAPCLPPHRSGREASNSQRSGFVGRTMLRKGARRLFRNQPVLDPNQVHRVRRCISTHTSTSL